MSAPVRYIVSTHTPVNLAGDRVAYIRPIPGEVWLARLGTIPPAFTNTIAAQSSQVRKAAAEHFARENPDWGIKFAAVLLTESVVAIRTPDDRDPEKVHTDPIRLTEKPQHEAGPGELSLEVLDPEDVEKISAAALELNGFTTEAAEQHRPFFRGEGLALFYRLLRAGLWLESARAPQVADDEDLEARRDLRSDAGGEAGPN